jgi:hypothetical protein
MNYNYKEIKISIGNGAWNPQKHDLVLTYNSKSPLGFVMKWTPVKEEVEPEIVKFDEANDILKKFMI